MRPEERMHPLVYQTLIRYFSYRWGNALIQSLIRYRFGLRLSVRCLETFQKGEDCNVRCQENCPFRYFIM